jgi:hypothetical protein
MRVPVMDEALYSTAALHARQLLGVCNKLVSLRGKEGDSKVTRLS